MDQASLQALGERLEESQKTIISVREKALAANRLEHVAMVDDMIALGLQMALYLTLLIEGKTSDQSMLHDVREYCELAEELGKEFVDGPAVEQ